MKLKTLLATSILALSTQAGVIETGEEEKGLRQGGVRVPAERVRILDRSQQPDITFERGAFTLTSPDGTVQTLSAQSVRGVPSDATEDQFSSFLAHGFLRVKQNASHDDYDLEATVDGKGGMPPKRNKYVVAADIVKAYFAKNPVTLAQIQRQGTIYYEKVVASFLNLIKSPDFERKISDYARRSGHCIKETRTFAFRYLRDQVSRKGAFATALDLYSKYEAVDGIFNLGLDTTHLLFDFLQEECLDLLPSERDKRQFISIAAEIEGGKFDRVEELIGRIAFSREIEEASIDGIAGMLHRASLKDQHSRVEQALRDSRKRDKREKEQNARAEALGRF